MKVLKYLIVLVCALYLGTVHGGPGGDVVGNGLVKMANKPITEAQAKVYALKNIKAQIKAKKIKPVWGSSKLVSAKLATFRKKKAWVVTYTNAKVKGKKLYIMLSNKGEFIDANHTGK